MDKYLTINQVAERLGLTSNAIRKWIVAKKCPFPFIKINGALRIRESALENYLKRKTVTQLS